MHLSLEDQKKYKSLYVETEREYVQALLHTLQLLREDATNQEAITIAHRSVHTLKSQNTLMNHEQISQAAGIMENLLKQVLNKTQTLSVALLDALLTTAGEMNEAINAIENNEAEKDLSKGLAQLTEIIEHN
jgi:chemotaxis protein histidine kinase CheA